MTVELQVKLNGPTERQDAVRALVDLRRVLRLMGLLEASAARVDQPENATTLRSPPSALGRCPRRPCPKRHLRTPSVRNGGSDAGEGLRGGRAADRGSGLGWSPDGKRIAFQGDKDGGCLFIINAPGKTPDAWSTVARLVSI